MKSSSQLQLPLSHEEVNIADMSLDVVQCFPLMGEAKGAGLGIANKKHSDLLIFKRDSFLAIL